MRLWVRELVVVSFANKPAPHQPVRRQRLGLSDDGAVVVAVVVAVVWAFGNHAWANRTVFELKSKDKAIFN